MIGETLSHYRIVGKVGAGGMGVFYRAHYSRFEPSIAIKVLPSAASRDSMRIKRFQREARTSGALNHPNILATCDLWVSLETDTLETNTRIRITGGGSN